MKALILFTFAFLIISCENSLKTDQSAIETPIPELHIQKGQVVIEYIAHACFLLHTSKKTIMIDPYKSRHWLGYDFPKGLEVDAVYSTHPHYDHDGGIFLGSKPYWHCETPIIRAPKVYEEEDMIVQGIVGKHSEPYGKEFGQMNIIWVFEIDSLRIAHWGDNGPLTAENIEEMGRIDILMIPMDGDFHILKKEEYQSILDTLQPKIIIPMHYRIPELEASADSPKNLKDVDGFLENRPPTINESRGGESLLPPVKRLSSNKETFSVVELPTETTYYVFKHSPLVVKPE